MKNHILALYILTGILLLLAAYLKSSSVCFSAVSVFCISSGIEVAENVLTKASKDAEIVSLLIRMDKLEKEHKGLSSDIINVAERAKTILGEQF